MRVAGDEPFPPIYVDSKTEGEASPRLHGPIVTRILRFICFRQRWTEASQSQLKKVKKNWVREKYKQEKTDDRLVRRFWSFIEQGLRGRNVLHSYICTAWLLKQLF